MSTTESGYSGFYSALSLDQLRRISDRLSDSVATCYGYRDWQTVAGQQMTKNGFTYMIARLSNGKFYTRFDRGVSFDRIYRGQCNVSKWVDTQQLFAEQEYAVGISSEGEVLSTLTEVDSFLRRLRPGKLKQIVELYDKGGQLLGLTAEGRVLVENPYGVFHLRENDRRDVELVREIQKELCSWPPLKKLYKASDMLLGLTEEGQVYCCTTAAYLSTERRELLCKLSNLQGIHSICFVQRMSDYSDIPVLLGKDGQVTPLPGTHLKKYTDVVQIRADQDHLLHLDRGGVLYRSGCEIDRDVVAILHNGYAKADGTVYVREFADSAVYTMVQDLQLFDSIERIEEEWAAAEAQVKAYREYLAELSAEIRAREKSLAQKQREIQMAELELSGLGLFKRKEKKAITDRIALLQSDTTHLQQERDELSTKLEKYSDTKATWQRINLQAQQSAMMEQIRKMAATPVISEKPKDVSVLKSAAVGSILAGPPGAIVGAIYAMDQNNRKKG